MDIIKRTRFLKNILTSKEFNEIKMDKHAFEKSLELYNEEYIDSVHVITINDKRFIISKHDVSKLHKDWKKTLGELSLKEKLLNPVYVEVEPNGMMIIE